MNKQVHTKEAENRTRKGWNGTIAAKGLGVRSPFLSHPRLRYQSFAQDLQSTRTKGTRLTLLLFPTSLAGFRKEQERSCPHNHRCISPSRWTRREGSGDVEPPCLSLGASHFSTCNQASSSSNVPRAAGQSRISSRPADLFKGSLLSRAVHAVIPTPQKRAEFASVTPRGALLYQNTVAVTTRKRNKRPPPSPSGERATTLNEEETLESFSSFKILFKQMPPESRGHLDASPHTQDSVRPRAPANSLKGPTDGLPGSVRGPGAKL